MESKYQSKWYLALNEIKKLFCFFIFIFLLIFIGFNFETYYTYLKFDLNQIFPSKLKNIDQSESMGIIPSNFLNEADRNEGENYEVKYNQPNSISIPKINIDVPILYPESNEKKEILIALKEGVVIYPGSALPGEKGTTIILGHSSPPILYRGEYDAIFSLLNKLEKGDDITIYYDQKKYLYEVDNKYIFYPQQEISPSNNKSKPALVLMSCWPLGTDLKRIAVEAREIY